MWRNLLGDEIGCVVVDVVVRTSEMVMPSQCWWDNVWLQKVLHGFFAWGYQIKRLHVQSELRSLHLRCDIQG